MIIPDNPYQIIYTSIIKLMINIKMLYIKMKDTYVPPYHTGKYC